MNFRQHVLRFEVREFLLFLVEKKRKRNSRFSQRAFSRYLGLSPSTLNEILCGKRQISKTSHEKITRALEQDRDFDQSLNEFMQFSSFRHYNNIDKMNEAFEELVNLSSLSKNRDKKLFCAFFVSTNQSDINWLREQMESSTGKNFLKRDVCEVKFWTG